MDTILSEVAWGVRSTVSTVAGASPGQMVFKRDMIFDRPFDVRYEDILRRKQKHSDQNIKRENAKRVKYEYKPGDKVLLDRGIIQRKLLPKRDGPYEIV